MTYTKALPTKKYRVRAILPIKVPERNEITLQYSLTCDSPALCKLLRLHWASSGQADFPVASSFAFLVSDSFILSFLKIPQLFLMQRDHSVALLLSTATDTWKLQRIICLSTRVLITKWRSFPFNAWQRKNMLWSVGRGWKRVCMENVWLLLEAQITSTSGIQTCLINCLNIIP